MNDQSDKSSLSFAQISIIWASPPLSLLDANQAKRFIWNPFLPLSCLLMVFQANSQQGELLPIQVQKSASMDISKYHLTFAIPFFNGCAHRFCPRLGCCLISSHFCFGD